MSDVIALRGLMATGKLAEAWSLYLDTPSTDPEWHLEGGLVAFRADNIMAARTAAERGMSLWPVGAVRVKLVFLLGEMRRRIGEPLPAIEQFTEVLSMLDHLPELRPLLRGSALYNRGLALMSCYRPSDALADYQAALVEFEREGLTRYRRMALQNAAWTAVDLGDYGLAQTYLDESEPLLESQEARWRQTAARAWVSQGQQNTEEAMALCR